MEKEITVKVTIPEGYDDVIFNKETNQLSFIKNRPKSWEEAIETFANKQVFGIHGDSTIKEFTCIESASKSWENTITSYRETEAFLALMKLRLIRKAWIKDWKAFDDKLEINGPVWCIDIDEQGEFDIECYDCASTYLSFPSHDMAVEFLETFKDLIEKTKPLYL